MKLLMIEDDALLAEQVKAGLEAEGFSVDIAADGEEGLYLLEQGGYDAAVIDRMLPGMDGAALLKKARHEGIAIPAIMATALGQIEDRIEGLDAGADDYIVKPFDIRELSARLRAMLRRPAVLAERELKYLDIELKLGDMVLSGEKGCRAVTPTEANLLEALILKAETIIPRNRLFARVWGAGSEIMDSSLDIYIYYVRRHLAAVSDSVVITTKRGVGYKLEKKDDRKA